MADAIQFDDLNFSREYIGVGQLVDGIFTVESFFSTQLRVNGSISNPGDIIIATGGTSRFPVGVRLIATEHDNNDSIVFAYSFSGGPPYSVQPNQLIISNKPLKIGQEITYTNSVLGDYIAAPLDIPGVIAAGQTLKEGDTLSLSITDADGFEAAPIVTISSGGKVLGTPSATNVYFGTFQPPTLSVASYILGFDVRDQVITASASYIDLNGNNSIATKDIFVQDVDRLGGIATTGWIGSAVAASEGGTAVTAMISDPDGNPVGGSFTFSWNGNVLQKGTSETLIPGFERAGQSIDISAEYVDGQGHQSKATGSFVLGYPRNASSLYSYIGEAPASAVQADVGSNIIEGQAGQANIINGSSASDTVSYGNSFAGVVVDLNAQLTWDGIANDTLVSVENAIGSRYDDTLLGDAGTNVFDGGAGGTDTINGLGGIDTISYASSTVGVVIDLNAQRTWDRRSTDTLVSVENAIGSQYDDTLLGDAGNNVFDGGAGGTDTINGLGGIDTISYASSTVGVVIDLNAQRTWDGTALDTLVSIENAIGSRYDDTLLGDVGNNVLDGGAGGTDTINGLGGIDTVSYANSSVGAVIDLNAQRTWDGTALDTFVSIENAIGSRYDDTLLGDAGNNVLDGGAGGTDTINGLGGIDTVSYANSSVGAVIDLNAQRSWDGTALDTLVSIENAIGSRYDDTLLGDAGNNVLDGGAGGTDTINGLGGIDTISHASSSGRVVIDLNAQRTWDGTALDTLVSIENAIGSRYDDDVLGDAGNNVLDGGSGGSDFINGLGGIDTVSYASSVVGTVVDLNAQKTWDGSATDTLSSIENAIGSQYNDTLIGSSANNFLVGGGGSDTFLFKAIFGQDVISDFRTGVGAESDIIAFDRGVFVNDNPLQSATQFGSDVILAATYGSSIKLLDIKLTELNIDSFHII